jgi:AraC-like DNA-binding protein
MMPVHFFKHLLPHGTAATSLLPSADLQQVVDRFVVVRQGKHECQQLAFSDGIPLLVITLDTATAFSIGKNGQQQLLQHAWVGSAYLANTYMQQLSTEAYLLVVRFTADGFYRFCSQAVQHLRYGQLQPLTEVTGNTAPERFTKAIHLAVTLPEKIRLAEELIRCQLKTTVRGNACLQKAVQLQQNAKGCLPVDQLATRLNVNYKWLERNFLLYLGISPKEYARVQRFLHAYFHLLQTRGADVMGVAVNNGYYDQNHFTKEFKLFTGMPPLRYLRTQDEL